MNFLLKSIFIISLSLPAFTAEFQNLFTPDPLIWDKTLSQLKTEILQPGGFRWIKEGEKANSFSSVTLGGIKSYETIVNLQNEKAVKFVFSFYNRGDAGLISSADFSEIKTKAVAIAQKISGRIKPIISKKRVKYAYLEETVWRASCFTCCITSSRSKRHREGSRRVPDRYEFLKLEISPRSSSKVKKKEKFELSKPQKNKNGDVELLNVPMVDQGMKGYCAVATVERVMKFYQLDVDQHQIAQLANSSADRGTSSDVMYEILGKAGVKLGIKVKQQITFESRDFEKVAKNHDRYTKKSGGIEVGDLRQYDSLLSVYDIYRKNPDDFIKAMAKMSDFKKFRSEVVNNTNKGKPTIWTVIVGVLKEGKNIPQNSGGHMRLITGYNFTQKGEEYVIFTDSWGAGHERKIMPLKEAWAITTGIAVISPR